MSTEGADGVNNLAPFSFFMGVCQEPPTIAFSSSPRAGDRKDTVRNALHTGRVDMHRLRPVGRLTGHLYTHVHDIVEMKRPSENYRG